MSYSNVVRSGLKLKNVASQPAVSLGRKRQRKRIPESEKLDLKKESDVPVKKKSDVEDGDKSPVTVESEDDGTHSTKKVCVDEDPTEQLLEDVIGPDEHLTPAEKSFRLTQKKREQDRTDKRLSLTHRQRMEKFNAHLKTLPERRS